MTRTEAREYLLMLTDMDDCAVTLRADKAELLEALQALAEDESSHTDEEIRAAVNAQYYADRNEKTLTRDEFADGVMAELNKPAEPPIHLDVPVMIDGPKGTRHLIYANSINLHDTNIRVLIPADTVIKWGMACWDGARSRAQYVEFWEQKIADYQTNGPSHE